MKNKEITSLTNDQITEQIKKSESELTKLQFSHAVSPLANPSRIELLKRDIARLKFHLHNRTLTSVADKVKSGELTHLNARTFLAESKLTTPLTLAKVKKIVGRNNK